MGAPSRALPSGRVALFFSDIEGSTALLGRLGETYGDVLDIHDQIIRAAFDRHGGHEFSNEGDAFGAAFADPVEAARAALELQDEINDHPWPGDEHVRVRMGLHYGEPKLRGNDYWGEDVHFAARICAAAHGGQVIISAAMRATVAEDQALTLGHHGLKDFPTPRELFQLHPPGEQPAPFPAPRTLSTFHNNLPSISAPMIGRDQELADLAAMITSGRRLVTIIGPGGMGKTRLAVAVGEHLASSFADGVAFVALSPVDADHAATALAEAVGAARGGEPEVAVREHLRGKRMLVILDNCEHLTETAAELAAGLLESSPDVRVLATAQVPLGLAEETVHRLTSLSTGASPGAHDPGGSAVEMLVARAQARDSSFIVTETDRGALEHLCQLLEGLPLAIELAAARIRVFGVERLVHALERDVDALGSRDHDVPTRQRSLRAALDWTLSLLTTVEHDVFVALAAFAESWSIEEAEQLLADDLDELAVWDALSRLIDASLVLVKGDGRFAMSERVRRHAVDLLDAADDGRRWRLRHAEVVAREMRESTLETYVDYRRMLANSADLLPEVLQALSWSRERAPDAYRHVLGLCAPGLATLGHLSVVVDDIPGLAGGEVEPQDYDDAALAFAVGLVHAMRWSTDTAAEVGTFERAARGYATFGDPREVYAAGVLASVALEAAGLTGPGRVRVDELAPVVAAIDDHRWREEWERRGALMFEHSAADLAERRRILDRWGVGTGSYSIGHAYNEGIIAAHDGEPLAALGWCEQALREVPHQQLYITLNQVKCTAWVLVLLGHDAVAVELCGAIETIYRARTGSEHGNMLPDYEAAFAAAEERLGPPAVAAARARGAALPYDELVDRTLTEIRRVIAQHAPSRVEAGEPS